MTHQSKQFQMFLLGPSQMSALFKRNVTNFIAKKMGKNVQNKTFPIHLDFLPKKIGCKFFKVGLCGPSYILLPLCMEITPCNCTL